MHNKECEIHREMEQLFPTKESRKTPKYQVFQEKKKLWSLRIILVDVLYKLDKLKKQLQDIIDKQEGLEASIHECESNLGEISTSKEIENGKTYTIRKDGLPF